MQAVWPVSGQLWSGRVGRQVGRQRGLGQCLALHLSDLRPWTEELGAWRGAVSREEQDRVAERS